MILDALIGLALHAEPLESQRTPTTAAVSANADREWSVARPNRGAHARVVARASTVPHGWERFARCVENRESHGNPTVLNHEGSGAAGLFQLMPPWRHGGPYNARERLIRFGMPKPAAKAVRVYLSSRPIHRWPAIYQRVVFAEALDDGLWWHWSGHTCNGLRPA